MEDEEKRSYYDRNELKVCKKQLEQYIPKTVKQIDILVPERVQLYYEKFPYEIYGEPIIRQRLRYKGVRENKMAYQECYSAAMMAYIYSIHRCAFCNYVHTENYVRKMINIAINWGLVIASEGKGMTRIDDEKNQWRF